MVKTNKILVVITEFPSVSETFILNQIVDLKERGYELTIFSYCYPSSKIVHSLFKKFQLQRDTVYHFKNHRGVLKKIFYAFLFIFQHFKRISLLRLFRFFTSNTSLSIQKRVMLLYDFPLLVFKDNFQVIHAHFGFNGKKVADCIDYFFERPSVFIVSFHGSDLTPSKVPEYKQLYKQLLEKADFFTVNSHYLKDIFLQVYSNSDRLILLPESIRSIEMEQYLVPKEFKGTFDLVFCGRLVSWKGPDRAVAIVENLINKGFTNVRLHLIGGGELYDEINAYVRNNDLGNNILLHGPLSQNDVFNIFSKSHIFILPGISDPTTQRAEAQGLVIQEAQFFRLPVIVSDTGGSKFGFVDGKSGFLMDENASIDDYTIAIQKLIQDPSLIESMGDFGHQWVLEHFESKLNGNKLNNLF